MKLFLFSLYSNSKWSCFHCDQVFFFFLVHIFIFILLRQSIILMSAKYSPLRLGPWIWTFCPACRFYDSHSIKFGQINEYKMALVAMVYSFVLAKIRWRRNQAPFEQTHSSSFSNKNLSLLKSKYLLLLFWKNTLSIQNVPFIVRRKTKLATDVFKCFLNR